jgi:hypothetical protein
LLDSQISMGDKVFMNYKKVFLYTVIALGFISKISYEVTFNDFYTDKACQVYVADNLYNGDGAFMSTVNPNNLSEVDNTNPLIGYKLGYSYALQPMMCFMSSVNASILLDVFAVFIFYLSIFYICKLLNVSLKAQILLFIFYGFSMTPFFHIQSCDLFVTSISTVLLLVIIYTIQKSKYTILQALMIGFISFLPLFFKFSALPLIASSSFTFLLISILIKDKKIFYFSIYITMFVVFFFLLELFILPQYAAEKFLEKSFYPFQLIKFDAFVYKSFFFTDSIVLSFFTSNSFIVNIYRIITLLFSVGILFLLFNQGVKGLKNSRLRKKIAAEDAFITHGIIMLLLTCLSLIYLTVRVKGETWQEPYWTFVEETRYFSHLMVFIQLFIFIYAYKHKNIIIKNIYKSIVFTSLVFGVIYWSNHEFNLQIKNDDKYTFEGNNKDKLDLCEIINNYSTKSSKRIYIDDDFKNTIFIPVFSNVDYGLGLEKVKDKTLSATGSAELFVNILKENKEEYTSFINRNELLLVIESDLGSLYTKKFKNEK